MIKIISTFLYVGYLPFMPGTFASLAGIGLFYLIKDSTFAYVSFVSILIIMGFLVGGSAENLFGKKDARYIVIDETSGMLLSLIFIPYDYKFVILGFFLFRILDTLKPYPAGGLEKLKGSAGIMCDDLVAAVYTNLILQVVLRWASFKIS
ncbi:MAG: hypothetical protein A3K83_01990 [Omnitrophica WOR_2 bacterium RBG_13_44_8b]|nr:MAG: hypothetical protein A3K83_01990 [Omnitrophica WOR_2 bacterium RBG_13_44_8b]